MEYLVLKLMDGGKIKVVFDPSSLQYSVHKYKKGGDFEKTFESVQSIDLISFIKENCDDENEPYAPIVCKALKKGIPPTSIHKIPR